MRNLLNKLLQRPWLVYSLVALGVPGIAGTLLVWDFQRDCEAYARVTERPTKYESHR